MKSKTLDALNQILNSNLSALRTIGWEFSGKSNSEDVEWIEGNIQTVLKKMLSVLKTKSEPVVTEKKEG